MISPVTHGNYIGAGVQPDVQTLSAETLITGYTLALKAARPSLDSDDLRKEKAEAIQNPKAALLQEIDGFSRD